MKTTLALLTLLLLAGCGPSAHELSVRRLDAAILQAMSTATPEQMQQALTVMQMNQATEAANADRQLQTLHLLNEAVGNINGMYAHPAPAPTLQTTHCTQNPFNGNVTCTTF
jgi:hypothetical protein